MRMLLEIEGKKAEQVSEFGRIEAALKELEGSGPHSYASLTRQDGSYVQVAGGKEKCLIEKRDIEDNKHYRASFGKLVSTSDNQQIIECGAGRINVLANEVFSVEDVISVWRSFFHRVPLPPTIIWKDMTDVFR